MKTTVRYHLTPVRMAITKRTHVGEDVKKRERLCTACGNVNWYSHYGKQYGGSSKKLKIELPYDLAIPLLGIYPQEMKSVSQRDTSTPIFTSALFTIAKI